MKKLKKNSLLYISLGSILLFSFFLFFFTSKTYETISSLSFSVRQWFGHYYLWLGLICVLLLCITALSPWGKRRLGTPDDRPEFSRMAWISMLYSAGMGAGILLRAVQEPVFMMRNPPIKTNAPSEIIALEYTFYQWGLTAWAFYAIFAIIIGHYLFVKSTKVLSSSAFYSLKKTISSEKTQTILFKTIDILCILTTVFGLVGAIGLGTTQIKGGLQHLTDTNLTVQGVIGMIVLISVLALISAYRGVNKGIKILSTWNIYITLFLLLVVFFHGNIPSMIQTFFMALYRYVIDFIPMSLAIGVYDPGEAFLTDWTYYYWAFWLAWAPFTGIFIARISKGRTLREVIIGVLLIPSLGTFIWFTVFGQSAFQMVQTGTYEGAFDNVFTSIFVFFEHFPFQFILNTITITLLISFLITSLDSAIFVLSMFTDNGEKIPSKKHRILWGVVLSILTIGIVLLGNVKEGADVLTAMQKLLIITSLPFSFLLLLMIFLFIRDYRR